MNFENYTINSRNAINLSASIADENNHQKIMATHLLLALVAEGSDKLLRGLGHAKERVMQRYYMH